MSTMTLEPFPLFVDSNGPFSPSHLSASKMNPFNFLNSSSSSASEFRPRIKVPSKVTEYFELCYYQYEVTFGLYVMTPPEKLVLNSIVFTICAALLFGICFGLQPMLIRSLCRLVWYIHGTFEGIESVCTEGGIIGKCMT